VVDRALSMPSVRAAAGRPSQFAAYSAVSSCQPEGIAAQVITPGRDCGRPAGQGRRWAVTLTCHAKRQTE
jgi:hypothetical protein